MSSVPPNLGPSSHKRAPSSQLNALDRSIRPRVDSLEKPPARQSGLVSPDVPHPSATENDDGWDSLDDSFIAHRYKKEASASTTLDYSLLLNAIVRHSPRYQVQTTSQFTQTVIESLIATSASARKRLDQAWANKKFDRVLPELLVEISKTNKAPVKSNNVAIQTAALAWDAPYTAELHKILYNNINNMTRNKMFANTAKIVQSSGSGKSRMVDELAKTLFTVPFNLRVDDPESILGSWPPSDTDVRKHLQCDLQEERCKVAYYKFLGGVFRTVKEHLETDPSLPHYTHETLASSWRGYLASTGNRANLYRRICSETKEIEPSSTLNDQRIKARDEARAELQSLLQFIPQPPPTVDQPVKLLLYFDEADALDIVITNSEDKTTLYDVLLWCLNALIPSPLFVLFLSTKPGCAYLSPPPEMARTARVVLGENSMQAPITETPFDCHPSLPIDPTTLDLNRISSIEFMSMFGRPLWWSMRDALAKTHYARSSYVDSTVINLAREKLIHCSHRSQKDENIGDGALVVLDVRLMLNLEADRMVDDISARLVASHMRTAFSIPADRQCIRSGYPSEPVLAEAAAQQMRRFRRKEYPSVRASDTTDYYVSPTIFTLQKHIGGCLLDLGESGEVIARVILTEAYDRAVEVEFSIDFRTIPGFRENPLVYSKGCCVTTFAKEIFRNPAEILDSFPDNVLSQTRLQDAFESSIIRFTHFVKMRDDSALSPNGLLSGFIRCMAFIGSTDQEVANIFVPVLMDRNKPLSISNITALLIQVRRRKTVGSTAACVIDADRLEPFRHSGIAEKTLHPYLTWIMELGVRSPPDRKTPTVQSQAGERSKELPKSSAPSTFLTPAAFPFTPSEADFLARGEKKADGFTEELRPRYALKIHGCSNTVYKGITLSENQKYAALLASGDFLEQHARKDVESLNAVRTQKPFWTRGKASFGWIRDFILNEEEDEILPGIVVGKYGEST